jgi:hypothetical protein
MFGHRRTGISNIIVDAKCWLPQKPGPDSPESHGERVRKGRIVETLGDPAVPVITPRHKERVFLYPRAPSL